MLTGRFNGITKNELNNIIKKAGGKLSETVSSQTDFVIAGGGMGGFSNKNKKAVDLNVLILTQEGFRDFIRDKIND